MCGCKSAMVYRPDALTKDKLVCERAGVTCWSMQGLPPPPSYAQSSSTFAAPISLDAYRAHATAK